MKRIRTKLILSLFAVTLLPVYPVYYLVKNLLHRSLAIGYNQNVETALESASGISRTLYAKYKAETLTVTNKIADLCNTKKINFNRPATESCLQDLEKYKVLFYDNTGRLINAFTNSEQHTFPQIYQNDLAAISQKTETAILESPGGVEHIVAFAPLLQNGVRVGSLIVINAVTPEFTEKAQAVFKVLQMFKTLDFYEGELKGGFITSFLVVYVPIALFSIALGIYFSSRITSPLQSLVGATKKVAAGDCDYRLQVKTRDENGDLVQSF